jgi:hypothetical protein
MSRHRVAPLLVLVVIAAARQEARAQNLVVNPGGEGRFVDKEGGFSLTPPSRWRPVDPAAYTVPGTLRAGWSPDGSTSILVFTIHLAEPVTAGFLLDQNRSAAKRTPGAEIREERTFEVGGMRAMSFIFTAPGTGGAVEPRGKEPTAQHWVAIPHQREVLFLLLTSREIGFEPAEAAFRAVLSTLEVSGSQTDEQTVPR